MKVGIQLSLSDINHIAEQCSEVGVDEIVLSVSAIPEFASKGFVNSDDIEIFREKLAGLSINLSGMIPPNPSKEAVLGDNADEVANLCKILKAIGEAGIKTALFYPFDRFKNYLAEYHHEKPPLEVMPNDEKWSEIIKFFGQISSIAEDADVKIANHVFAVDIMSQILDEVKSPNLGVVYCTGMYMFGADPYSAIDIYGIEKIFLCHARNLVRHGPGRQGHEEVPLNKGDIDMSRHIHNLVKAGYDGLIIPEHLGKAGDMVDSVTYPKNVDKRINHWVLYWFGGNKH